MSNTLLISVRPKFAARIFAGEKTVELRRVRPHVAPGDTILFYISSPEKKIGALSKIKRITDAKVDELWQEVKADAAVTQAEYIEYFEGVDTGYAIHFSEIKKFTDPIELNHIKEIIPGFTAPQSYRYFSPTELSNVLAAACLP